MIAIRSEIVIGKSILDAVVGTGDIDPALAGVGFGAIVLTVSVVPLSFSISKLN